MIIIPDLTDLPRPSTARTLFGFPVVCDLPEIENSVTFGDLLAYAPKPGADSEPDFANTSPTS